MAATTTKLVTYQEWLQMPEVSGEMEEVVDGAIRLAPPPKFPHAITISNLGSLLGEQFDRKAVRVLTAAFGLIIRKSPLTTRVPDIAVFTKKNMVIADGFVHSAPELVVEVLSPGHTRGDVSQRLADYASLGVPEVWTASPEAHVIEALQLKEGALRTVKFLSSGTLAPKLFPEAVIDVFEIWVE